VIVFPNCKVNLGLRVLRKRTDGYHDLETVFYPLPYFDVLEILGPGKGNSKFSFSTTGLLVESNLNNLCVKAYELLKKDFPGLPSVVTHLHKMIPIGAGLGGGSADAAFTLKLLNEKFGLGLTLQQLTDYALRLGSDCPFFINNKPAFATGRGDVLEQLDLDLSGYKFLLINPGIVVKTSEAFEGIKPFVPENSLKAIIGGPISTWRSGLVNDFEKSIFVQHPEIETIKNLLYENGALYASMSGSGSSVYGIFEKETKLSFDFPSHYLVKHLIS
jgi:4-diphosphocytidyl-2-C-methyl-D-erythritol kinase